MVEVDRRRRRALVPSASARSGPVARPEADLSGHPVLQLRRWLRGRGDQRPSAGDRHRDSVQGRRRFGRRRVAQPRARSTPTGSTRSPTTRSRPSSSSLRRRSRRRSPRRGSTGARAGAGAAARRAALAAGGRLAERDAGCRQPRHRGDGRLRFVAAAPSRSLLADCRAGPGSRSRVPDLGATPRARSRPARLERPARGRRARSAGCTRATGLDLADDVFGWLGDAAAFVQGTGRPGFSAGLIAETTDPEAPRALLEAARRVAERESGLRSSGPPEGADYGFSIGLPGVGGGAEAGVVGDELVAVVGATVEPGARARRDARRQRATSRARSSRWATISRRPVRRPALVLRGRRGGCGRRHRLRDAASLPRRVRKPDRRQQCRRTGSSIRRFTVSLASE